jgi:hypothetical protein
VEKYKAESLTDWVARQPICSGKVQGRRQTDGQVLLLDNPHTLKMFKEYVRSRRIKSPDSVKCSNYSTNTCISPRLLPLISTLVASAD